MFVLKIVVGILGVLVPFGIVFYVMCRAKRNRGSMHGGGIDGYRRIRRGP